MHQLAWLHEAVYAAGGGRTVSDDLIEQLDERSIAAWYCDDGSFSGNYRRWGHGKSVIYCSGLEPRGQGAAGRCGASSSAWDGPTVRERELLFSGERTRAFQERIAPYVHPSLDYKLHPDLRGRFAVASGHERRPSERHRGSSRGRACGRCR